jgi:two-component system OmpR family sensor kinase
VTRREPGDGDQDTRAVRRAVRVVSGQITAASCLLVTAIVVAAVLVVVHQSQPSELLEPPDPGAQNFYVDTDLVLLALILIGVGAIAFAAAVSRLIARRAVRPLGQALRIQREFVADASHELRTPLAVLDARIQLLQHRTGADEPSHEALDELRADSRALIEIVNDLLLVADGSPTDPNAAPTDAVRTALAAVATLRVLAGERGISLSFAADSAAFVRMPQTGLRRCVTALIDNAINHSPDGSAVDVHLTTTGQHVLIQVRDQGGGLQGIEPGRVFDRFAHSASSSGDGHRAGFGIGLALVRDLAVRHGGQVEVVTTSQAGTTFVLSLPAVP